MVATGFWFINALNKEHDILVHYPLDFVFDDKEVIITYPLPKTILIDIHGAGWNLLFRTFYFLASPLRVELHNPTEVRYLTRSTLLPLLSDQLNLDINHLLTDTLYINIERQLSKRVAVNVDSIGISLEEGYRIRGPIEIYPDSIEIVGPQSIISRMEDDYYLMLPFNQIDNSIDEKVEVSFSYEGLMEATPPHVHVSFEVDKVGQ